MISPSSHEQVKVVSISAIDYILLADFADRQIKGQPTVTMLKV